MNKKREMDASTRGIYIQDKELLSTEFSKVGSYITYVLDIKKKKLYIMPCSTKTRNKISKRRLKNITKSVIDLRKESIRNCFKECSDGYITLTIKKNIIIVEGYVAGEEKVSITEKIFKSRKLTRLKKLLGVSSLKKKFELYLDISEIQKVAGYGDVKFTEGSFEYDSIEDVLLKKKLEIPQKYISICSGPGMLDKAMKDLGFEVEFAIDKDPSSCETFKYNISKKVECGDFMKKDKSSIPYAPIAISGTPCVGFTRTNTRTRLIDNPNNFLLREFIETIKQNRYLYFIYENVKDVLSLGNGQFIRELREELKDYKLNYDVLDNVDYNGCQNRERLIVIGTLMNSKVNLPKPSGTPQNIRSAFSGLCNDLPNRYEFSVPNKLTLERFKWIPMGGNFRDLPDHLQFSNTLNKHSNNYKRLHWDKPSVTLTHPRKINLIHPTENRIIDVREACRIQSLPDDFVICGSSLDKKYQQVCNGVPLTLGKAVAAAVKNSILEYNRKLNFA